ncbi:hypothetical protein MgSA37_03067 [Mucilaginibacter gotjawali]|uniref:Uncharacterized protein n=2 Tax=Mucilaginibacter gotjawali TaxID=1550579 RepID=A0A0X8X4E2_9SPHI|nr:hypothetical protein [Mucilaginibacter gotjawali]BAU54888.1 hypothetical protein MgSA37_03067 [Mucilaginibacter gotjawali]
MLQVLIDEFVLTGLKVAWELHLQYNSPSVLLNFI